MEAEVFILEEDKNLGTSNESKTPMKGSRGTKRKCQSPLTPGDVEVASSNKKRRKSASSIPVNRTGSPLLKPALTERQQMALIMQMTDPHKQGTLSGGEESVTSTPRSDPSWTPRSRVLRKNERGETLLHTACIKGDFKASSSLIEQGAEVNSADNAGWTPLHEACNYGHVKVVSLLLKHRAEVNARGMEGDTPLHDAAMNGHIKTVKLLLEYNSNPYQENDQGHTPIDVCTHKEILRLMTEERPLYVPVKDDSEEEDVFVSKDKRMRVRDSHVKVGSKGSSRSSADDSNREESSSDREGRDKERSLYRDDRGGANKTTTTTTTTPPVGVYSSGMDRKIDHTPKSRPRNVLYSDLSSSESESERSEVPGGHRGRYHLAKRGEAKQRLLGKLDESKEVDDTFKEMEGIARDSEVCGSDRNVQAKESLTADITTTTTTTQSTNVVTQPTPHHDDNSYLSPHHHHYGGEASSSTTAATTEATLPPPSGGGGGGGNSKACKGDTIHDSSAAGEGDVLTIDKTQSCVVPSSLKPEFQDWESRVTDSAPSPPRNDPPETTPTPPQTSDPCEKNDACISPKASPRRPEIPPPPPPGECDAKETIHADTPPREMPVLEAVPLLETTLESSEEEEEVAPTRLLRSAVRKLNLPTTRQSGDSGEEEGLVVSWSLALVRSCNTSPENSRIYPDEPRRNSDKTNDGSWSSHSISRLERMDVTFSAPGRSNSASSVDTCSSGSGREGGETSHGIRHSRKPQQILSGKRIPEDRERTREELNSMNVSVDWGALSSKNGGALTHPPVEAPKEEDKDEMSTVISLPLVYTGRSDSIESTNSMLRSPASHQSHDGYPGNLNAVSQGSARDVLKVTPPHVIKTQPEAVKPFLVKGEGSQETPSKGVDYGSGQGTPDYDGRGFHHHTSNSSVLLPKKRHRPVIKSSIVHQRQKCCPPTTVPSPAHLSSFLMYCGNYRSKRPLQPTNPKLVYPPLTPSMYKLFSEQENDRIRLTANHLTEQDRMILCMEQELLRAHQRATKDRAPISACSVLLENLLPNVGTIMGVTNGSGLGGLQHDVDDTGEVTSPSEDEVVSVDGRLLSGLVQDVWDKFQDLRFTLLTRQRHETESLWLIQHLQWMSELGISRTYSSGHDVPRTHIPLSMCHFTHAQ